MLVNPLFDQEDDSQKPIHQDEGYALQHRKGRTIHPVTKGLRSSGYTPVAPQQASVVKGQVPAVELIRQKVAALYTDEPDVGEELQEAEAAQPMAHLSKHQQFMETLSKSGKSLAEIQTEWHAYYIGLPDDEKHQVWREFYQTNARQPSAYTSFVNQAAQAQQAAAATPPPEMPGMFSTSQNAPKAIVHEHLPAPDYEARKRRRTKSRSQIKKQILDKVNVSAETQAKAKQHFHSLVFGVGTGLLVLLIFLFGFFNEVFIAPFIQPSRHVSATPIILNSDSVAASADPEIIIPKINVQIPTVFDNTSTDEDAMQTALESGVTHYPTTPLPGQQGNTAFFGHSSNNIFNKGKYKFAFVLLHEMVPGDIFYLTYDKKVYTYRVYDKRIVPPSEVSVLNNVPGKTATATLITCDPPGTSTNRLVVWGEQISPDPAGATAPAAAPTQAVPTQLPSEAPTLWSRLTSWL